MTFAGPRGTVWKRLVDWVRNGEMPYEFPGWELAGRN
jgi:hypothetical protein